MKSGQLPADLDISDNDAMTKNENSKEDKMVTDDGNKTNDGTSNGNNEQKDGPSDMEQVCGCHWQLLFLVCLYD